MQFPLALTDALAQLLDGVSRKDLAAAAENQQQQGAGEQAQQQQIAGLQHGPDQLAENEGQPALPDGNPAAKSAAADASAGL